MSFRHSAELRAVLGGKTPLEFLEISLAKVVVLLAEGMFDVIKVGKWLCARIPFPVTYSLSTFPEWVLGTLPEFSNFLLDFWLLGEC